MYEIPSKGDIEKVTITAEGVLNSKDVIIEKKEG
jgi:hypothetical protein